MAFSRKIILGFSALLALSVCALAQTGTIRGVVLDPSGAVIAGAKVSARSTTTGETRSTASAAGGNFTIPSLPPGPYDVSAQSNGLTDVKVSNVTLTVDQVLSVTLHFAKVGATITTVDVRGDQMPQVETDSAQVSNLVDSKTLKDLPLILRDPYQLVLLSPGTIQTNGLGGFAVNGSRERNNNFLLDGVDNNDTSVPGIPSGLLAANPDSTQEFRVITNNFLPEFGRNTGAIIDVVTQGGTNQFHGDALWFGRYNYFGARDYFNTVANGKQDPYSRNIYGYSIGGPIFKNKTFFFFNGEHQRFRTSRQTTSVVPNAAFKSGIFTVHDDAGNPYTVDLTSPNSNNNLFGLSTDPTIANIFSKYPNPNGLAIDDLTGLLNFSATSHFKSDSYTLKLDHNITDKHRLSLRAGYTSSSDPDSFFDDFLPGIGATAFSAKVPSFALGFTSTLSSTLINEFHAGFNRNTNPFTCGNLATINSVGATDAFGRGRDYGFDGISSWACGTLGDSNGQSRRTGTYSLTDGITKVTGNHTVKFGAEFRFVYEDGFTSFSSREAVGFNPVTDFGINIIDFAPGVNPDPNGGLGNFANNQTYQDLSAALLGFNTSQFQSQYFNKSATRTADDLRRFRQREWGGYIQDSWKVRSNFTLNYGLRYQFNGVPYERDGNFTNLFADASGFAPFTFTLVGPSASRSLYNNDFKDFEPRFGFAWDPYKNGKTSIRGSYGIFHDRIFGNLFGNAKGNPPFQRDQSTFPGLPLAQVPLLPTAVPSATVPNIDPLTGFAFLAGPVTFDPNLKMPYSQNWNFGIQREILPTLALEINYVGSKGSRLLRVVDGNPPQPALVASLLAQGVDPSLLTFSLLRFGGLIGLYPNGQEAVNNTAFGSVSLNKSIAHSTYNSLQINVTKQASHGLSFGAAYTWAHGIDDGNDPLVAGGGGRGFPRNSFDLNQERGNSSFDIRHRGVVHYTYELPFGHDKRWLSSGIASRIAGGWQISGITSAQTGFPIDLFGNRDSEHTSLSARLDQIGSAAIPAGSPRTQTGPPVTAFARAAYGTIPNVSRNKFYGPGFSATNVVMEKDTAITEHVKLQLRAEIFNLLNQVNFNGPGNLIQSPGTFGVSTSIVGNPDGTTGARQMQFAAKIIF